VCILRGRIVIRRSNGVSVENFISAKDFDTL
jgi:hypothetical protein